MSAAREIAGVALGSNLGERARFLRMAAANLAALPEVFQLRGSAIYETTPWGVDALAPVQGDYLNAVVVFETTLAPQALLEALLAIEREAGRMRSGVRNAPRTLDLDLLFYGARCQSDPQLTLPHPRLAERAFVLAPLCDLLPDWRHPTLDESAKSLLGRCADRDEARLLGPLIP